MEKRIKREILDLDGIPKEVNWNTKKGWNQYKRKYQLKKPVRKLYWSVAAAVVFVLISVSILLDSESGKDNIIEITSGNKNKKELVLADMCRIWMNHNTFVRIDKQKKEIEIVGEVYFELTENESYEIKFPQGRLQARECSFNIKAPENSNEALVTVAEGNLEMIWESDIILLEKVKVNEQVKIIPQVAMVKTETTDNNYLAWKTEELYFNNAPLFAVIDKLEDLHDVEIELSERDLRYCMITSSFKSATLTAILGELQKQLNSKIENTGNKYLIVGDGC